MWRLVALTISPVHAVGTAGNVRLPIRCLYCCCLRMACVALSVSSLLLWGVCWSFLSLPTSRSYEPPNSPRFYNGNFWKKKKKKIYTHVHRRQKKMHLWREPLFPLQKRVRSVESAWVCPALPGAAPLNILGTVTSTSSGLWKKAIFALWRALIGCGHTTITTVVRLHLVRQLHVMSPLRRAYNAKTGPVRSSSQSVACQSRALAMHVSRALIEHTCGWKKRNANLYGNRVHACQCLDEFSLFFFFLRIAVARLH